MTFRWKIYMPYDVLLAPKLHFFEVVLNKKVQILCIYWAIQISH